MGSPTADDLRARLETHIQMEDFVLEVATRFLALRPDQDLDDAVNATLAEVGNLADVDLVGLFQVVGSRSNVLMTHRWSAPEVVASTDGSAQGPIEAVATWVDHLRAEKLHAVSDISATDGPDELQASLGSQGVQSLLVVPLLIANVPCGWLALAALRNPRQWGPETLTLAQLVAHSVAQSLRGCKDEQALQRGEARFRAFLEQHPDSMYVLELEPPMPVSLPEDEQVERILDSRVALSNDGGATIFGRKKAADVLGEPLRDLFVSAFTEGALDVLRQETYKFVRNGYRNRTDEAPNTTPDGEVVWVARTGHGVIEGGFLTTIWATVRDITEQKRARDDRELLTKRLHRAERLKSIGLLAGGVAHDFNNLLLAILGNADIAAVEPTHAERVRDALAEIRRAGQRAAELTRQLLAFSQRQPTVQKPLDLNALLRTMARMLHRLLPASIELDFIPGHDLGTVLGDEAQLEQLVLNLCLNARDAMSDRGRLTIETQNVRINGEYCRTHPWARPGRYVLLIVNDTGRGIDEDDLEHIFEPFFTKKQLGRGTGLGLATVYGIVKQHEGMIQVYSEVEVGTTFKIYLPISEHEAAHLGPEVRPAPPGGTETILLAEDENQVRSIVARLLERAGYTVEVVADGAEAVSLFESDPARFDLVLLDVVMPTMNGREAGARMRSIRPDVLIVFSSGYTGTVLDGVDLQALGSPVLHKPYDPDHLLLTVRRAIDAGAK
jgi:signal transduction histidine kinase